MASGCGCGTVYLGRTQTVTLTTSPASAVVSLANLGMTTPGEVRLPRNQPGGWVVFRASAPGYQPACMLVGGRLKAAYIVLDGLFMGLPMLVDFIGMGSLNALRQYPERVALKLRPLEPGETPQPLPSDAEAIRFRRLTWVDLCQPDYLTYVSARAARCDSRAARIASADGDAAKVWWTFYCGEGSFTCSSDRRFRQVTCN
ncbi:MAG: hypothetical protein HY699_18205 [Deltaproteobacteria bacterium]|nr:hypothetical protein [Deltaproteobacteria bacterium]